MFEILAQIDPGTALLIAGGVSAGGSVLGGLFGASSQKKAAEASAEAMAAASKRGEQIAREQMLLSAGQQQMALLTDLLYAKQKNKPVYTLGPTPAPLSMLDKINWIIQNWLTKMGLVSE